MSFQPEAPLFDAILDHRGWDPGPGALERANRAVHPLDGALLLALDLAGMEAPEDLAPFRAALQTEARRRLYPQRFGAGEDPGLALGRTFFPLAQAVLPQLAAQDLTSLSARLPFEALQEEELKRWPSGEDYRALMNHLEADGFLVCLAMAQHWQRLSIQDHVLGVTGLSLWIARQMAKAIPVDLPLLHGGAIGHDVGKFGCVGDEARRIPRLHYYYTHQYYASRGLPGMGHIATNHSCWDLELVRLPIETQLLIYSDFRVKDITDAEGRKRMAVISLKEAFDAILEKLEDLDDAKRLRYEAVYRKLRDMEDYAVSLGVSLDPPGFKISRRRAPDIPAGLSMVSLMNGHLRPDMVALAAGAQVGTLARFYATAHNIGVMERLRDLPALRHLLEEARSFKGWRELRTYLGIVGDYAPAFSEEQKALALGFFRELLSHRDDDIRYQAAVRMADLLALGEAQWRKDLPDGAVVEEAGWVLPQVGAVLDLLDLAGNEAEEDMAPREQVLYAVPVFLRRFLLSAEPALARAVLDLVVSRLRRRAGDHRPLVGLYTCESFELLAEHLDAEGRAFLPELAQSWAYHETPNVRLMAWRLLHLLAQFGQEEPALRESVRYSVGLLRNQARRQSSVAELFLLERMALLTDQTLLAERCVALREKDRFPIREVMLRNLKGQVGWVEKKVNCDYLLACVEAKAREGQDPEAYFASEVAFHLANLLKVSRVEGTRFHAGRCLVKLLPVLTDTQRNDLAIELLRSLQLDGEAVTRYIPRFLGLLLASLPLQELLEIVGDMEIDARRGKEDLQRLLVQASAWLVLALPAERLAKGLLRRLAGILLGALADSRLPTAHEGYAHLALLLDRLLQGLGEDPRLADLLRLITKKTLSLVTHRPGDSGRFFLVAQTLSALDRSLARVPVTFPKAPKVGFVPGTFDPFTSAHAGIVSRALAYCDEIFVQVDDFSWHKHAQPRHVRDELTWMALSPIPEAFLTPFQPPVNIANLDSLLALKRRLGARPLHLVVGSDVLDGASAYRKPGSPIWDIPHLVSTREEYQSRRWEAILGQFRAGVQVFRVDARMKDVSSTSLRGAFDRREELEPFCDPLIARTLRERRLYVNYPPRKTEVLESWWKLRHNPEGKGLPPDLARIVHLDAGRRVTRLSGRKPRTAVLLARETGEELAAITWMEATAAALPVALEDESLAAAAGGRLLGSGVLVDAIAVSPADPGLMQLDLLLSRVLGQWFSQGLLFALFGVPVEGGEALWEVLRHHGAGWLGDEPSESRGVRWAGIELTNPLVIVHDLEQLLQPQYMRLPKVRDSVQQARRAVSGFFAGREPGSGLLHIHEMDIKRQLAVWAKEHIGERPPGPREPDASWIILGLGRQFSRDLIGDCPTLGLDLERFLTWQGYEAGIAPSHGSPSLELQLTTARELGCDALLLVPFLDSAEPILQVMEACKRVRIHLREVLVGVTSASVHAALHLGRVPHRTGLVVPHWRGVLRESSLVPFVGGYSIEGRRPLSGSLMPSLNDCLPYHDPHPLGLPREGALDFSRTVLEQAGMLFQTLEDAFRGSEGRLMGLMDLSAVVRYPRCPPFPRGFTPPRDSSPRDLINEDLEALARLHPEGHHAHREGWRRG